MSIITRESLVGTSTAPFVEVCSSHERARWLTERKTGIGASDIAALLGLSPWKSALALYAEKIGAVDDDDRDAEALEWGLILEPVVCATFGRRTNRCVTPSGMLLRSTAPAAPFALATLDAWCSVGDRAWPLEIKTTGAHRSADWSEGPPPAYVAQVQWQMLVTGSPRATIACLIGGQKLVWADVERDEVMLARMVEAAREFWRCVESETPPPADGSDASRAALSALYPLDSGAMVDLPAALCEAADRLEAAKGRRKDAEAEIAEAENAIKQALGNATRGNLPDGRAFSWKLQKREGCTIKPSESRVFRAHQPKEMSR